MIEHIKNLDMEVPKFIYDNLHSRLLDKIMIGVTSLGDMGLIWILISVLLMVSGKYRKAGIMTICALILSAILANGILKNIIQRPRPFFENPLVDVLISKPLSYSFPSGHSASSFAAAGILAKAFKKYRFYVMALALLIAFSRMYLFVHYPSDIIGGAVLGLICSEIVFHVFGYIDGKNSR